MSSFKSLDLFGSGPHRFIDPAEGQQIVLRLAIGQTLPGSVSLGAQEIIVRIEGRLVADDDDKLSMQLDDIRAQLDNYATTGTLEDHHGRQWTDLRFARFEPAEPRRRGRKCSLSYTAKFYR